MLVHSKFKGILWIGAAGFIAWGIAVGLPLLSKKIPWSTERKIAAQLPDPPNGHLCRKSVPELMLIVNRLHPPTEQPDFPVEVQFVESSVQNAFASLGGRIFVYTGLLKTLRTPEELAGVLAHEIEHVRQRHVMEGIFTRLLTYQLVHMVFSGSPSGWFQFMNQLINLRFSRDQETSADLGAMERLKLAKISARGFRDFFERLEKENTVPDFFSDHPSPKNRAELVSPYLNLPSTAVLSAAEWERLKTSCSD